jgi:YidC/Oxa1 family membrane protein insertase
MLWRPLFNGLIWFYNIIPGQDLGLAILALTVVIRVVMTPLHWKARTAQQDLARIQPEIKRIQEQFKNNKEAQGKGLMELYSKHKVNPFSGCLVMIIQLPILIALFQVFRQGFEVEMLQYLYSFIANPGVLNHISFGFLDLSKGNLYLGVLAAATQFFQTKMTMPPQTTTSQKADFAQIFQKQMLYVFPLLLLVWSYTLPAALILYWTALNILGIVQEILVRYIAKRKQQRQQTV